MNRLPLIAALSFVAVASTACAAEDPSAPSDEVGTIEQAVECPTVYAYSYRGTETLFNRTNYNPWVVLTSGDRETNFYAYGVENGNRILWVKRVATRDYGAFIAHLHRDWEEAEIPGSESSWGISGSIKKGPPPPPTPGPIGCPTVNTVLESANQNLANTEIMFDRLKQL